MRDAKVQKRHTQGRPSAPFATQQRGLTIVELMVAMILGLILIGGVVSVFINNRQAVASNEGLARVQETGRFAFEMLMRDLRDAGHSPCGSPITANAYTSPKPWWADTDAGLVRGWDDAEPALNAAGVAISPFGTASGQRIQGTDAIRVLRTSWSDSRRSIVLAHTQTTAEIELQSVAMFNPARTATFVVMVCDGQSAALTEVSAVTTATKVISYSHLGASRTCTSNLGKINADCSISVAKTFAPGSHVASWSPVFWYVGSAGPGGTIRGLFRRSSDDGFQAREIVRGVVDMQIDYLLADTMTTPPTLATTWVSASDAAIATKWADPSVAIAAIRVQLTVESPDSVGTDGQPIQRQFFGVANYRSRDF